MNNKEKQRQQAMCTHRFRALPPEDRPYRYRCVDCRKLLKIASGIDLDRLDAIPHIVIEVRGGVVQFVDGFSGATAARKAYPLLSDPFTDEPKTGVRYVVVDHDNLDAEPPAEHQAHPMSGHYGPEGVGR